MRHIRSILVYLRNPDFAIVQKPCWDIEHLGIQYLAAALINATYSVTLIDAARESLSPQEVLMRIRLIEADFVGFSVTCATIQDALWISTQLKSQTLKIHICFGGHHATHAAEQILLNEHCVDSIVRGDGEETIVELLDALEGGRILAEIKGLYFVDRSGKVIKNDDRPALTELNKLPFPYRDTHILQGIKIATICSSRGCIYNCRFCSTPGFYALQGDPGWRARTADDVVDEIELLYKQYGCTYITIIDDNFIIPTRESRTRAQNIARKILERNIKVTIWMMCSVHAFTDRERPLLRLLKRAGFFQVCLGIESGVASTLGLYKKPASPQQNLAAVELLLESGFAVLCPIILFHPYITIKELEQSAFFIKSLLDMPNVGMISSYHTQLQVIPGTELYEQVQRDGLLLSSKPYLDPYAYKFVHPSVQFLAYNMSKIAPQVVPIDWLIWDVRSWFCLANQGGKVDNLLAQAYKEIQRVIGKINDINLEFFRLGLVIAKREDQQAFDKEASIYLTRLEEESSILRSTFEVIENRISSQTNNVAYNVMTL